MMMIAGLLLFCAVAGLCGPRGLALAALMLGCVFAAAVSAKLGLSAAF
jgi:hypothetical protein